MTDTLNAEESAKNRPDSTLLFAWLGFGFCLKCVAFSSLMVMLFLSILFVGLDIPLGMKPLTLGESLKIIYSAAVVPVFSVLGEILKGLSPWGYVAFALIAVIIKGPAWIRESLSVGRWKIGAFEYEGGGVASLFKKELGEVATSVGRVNKEIEEAYNSAKPYASQIRDRHQVGVLTSRVASAIAEIFENECPSDYRLTLYVPDFLFDDRLYQFTEYYDRAGLRASEGKAGRTFSVRYGIIGRVWRSGVAEIEGELISKEDQKLLSKDPKHGPIEKFIARRWGLNLEEAYRIKEYNSYGAIRLDFAENKVGVVFFYSKGKNAFGEEAVREKRLKEIEGVLERSALSSSLLEINHEVASWSGRIQIFKNS